MRIKVCSSILMIFQLFISFNSIAQKDTSSFNKQRLYTVVAVGSVGYAATMYGLSKTWYDKQDKTKFHFFNDATEWKQMDKLGHTYITFHEAQLFDELLLWSGLKAKNAMWFGSIAAFTVQSSIEIFDGFSPKYGASLSDIAANGIGALGYVFQKSQWSDIRIIPKYSFSSSGMAPLRPNVLGNNLIQQLLKDYNGQTYWLAFNLKSIFFRQSKFPAWLAISLGYGAHNMIYARDEQNFQMGYSPYRRLLLSLDLDLSKIHTKYKFVNYLFKRLNMIHIPAPAIEWNENNILFHPIYF